MRVRQDLSNGILFLKIKMALHAKFFIILTVFLRNSWKPTFFIFTRWNPRTKALGTFDGHTVSPQVRIALIYFRRHTNDFFRVFQILPTDKMGEWETSRSETMCGRISSSIEEPRKGCAQRRRISDNITFQLLPRIRQNVNVDNNILHAVTSCQFQ